MHAQKIGVCKGSEVGKGWESGGKVVLGCIGFAHGLRWLGGAGAAKLCMIPYKMLSVTIAWRVASLRRVAATCLTAATCLRW
jgi:hypothetical protein